MIRRLIFWLFKLTFVLTVLLALLAAVAWFYPEKILCVDSGRNVSADVIIVLGGGQHERPQRAAELFKAHIPPRIIVSGAGDDEINRQLLVIAGVPARFIEVEGKSTTTCENAEFTIRRLQAEKVRSAIVVTSWYHSRRALMTFEHFAPGIKFYSRPSYYGFDAAEWRHSGVGRHMWLEFLKLPGYWVRYGINPLRTTR